MMKRNEILFTGKNLTKKLLTTLSLGLLFASNLNAEQINVNKADVEQLLNTYYDICQSTTRETWDKNLEAMKKIVEDPKVAQGKLQACSSTFKQQIRNKNIYKDLDITRKFKINKIERSNTQGYISVRHDLFAWEDNNYRLPDGKKPVVLGGGGRDINIKPIKNPNGTIRWVIGGTYDRF